jgi:hypothetical protein
MTDRTAVGLRSRTEIGGLALVATGVLWLLGNWHVGAPPSYGAGVLTVIAGILLLGGMAALALGSRGVFGRSPLARTAAIVFGANLLASSLFATVWSSDRASAGAITVNLALGVIFTASIVCVAIWETRRRRHSRLFRALLWAIAVSYFAEVALTAGAVPSPALLALGALFGVLLPLCLIAFGLVSLQRSRD